MFRSILLVIFLLYYPIVQANFSYFEFSQEDNKNRYNQLIEELRCPKCQNQNLAGSDSPIAVDLRKQVHSLVESGKTDQQIETYLVDRYGYFILYKTPFTIETLFLWLMPILALLLGFILVSQIKRTQKKKNQPLNDHEMTKLKLILSKYS